MKKQLLFVAVMAITFTQAQVSLVKDINPGSGDGVTAEFVKFNNLLFFAGNNVTDGFELWKSDGTNTGTELITNIAASGASSNPHELYYWSVTNEVFFAATTGGQNIEPFKTDGTVAGTMALADIHPGNSSHPSGFTGFSNSLYFTAEDDFGDSEVYSTDGTPAGTSLFKEINFNNSQPGSNANSYTVFNGNMYFSATTGPGNFGQELWISDGTSANTVMLKNINSTGSSNPANLTIFNNKIYFSANDGNGRQLWETDGTQTGTRIVTLTINGFPIPQSTLLDVDNLLVLNNELYFTSTSATNGNELVKMNISGALTLYDIVNGTLSSNPSNLFPFNNEIYFTCDNGVDGVELFKTNGNTANLIKNINTSNSNPDSNPTGFTEYFGELFFSANDGTNGIELWKTDGTNAGTVLVSDINTTGDSNPENLTVAGDNLFFSATTPVTGKELFKYRDPSLPSNQTITFNALANKTFGEADFNLTATASSNLAVSYASSDTNVATIIGNTVTIVGVGTTTITASQPGDASYNAALDVTQTLIVDKATQTITFNPLANKTFGDADFQLSATTSSNLAVSYTSSNTNVATINGNTVTIVGLGSTTITANQTGNANYNAAVGVSQTLTVDKANQTITFNTLSNKTFGDADFQLTATASSNLSVSYASSDTNVATVNGSTVTIVGAGTTTITANQSGNNNYNAASNISQNLTINKAVRVVTIDPIPTKTFGDPNFFITTSVAGGVPQNNRIFYYFANSSTSNVVTLNVNTGEVSIIGTGVVNFSIEYRVEANYVRTDVSGSFTVNQANQTITFNPLADVDVADSDFSLTASSNSGLSLSYVSSNPSVASVTGNVVSINAIGTTTFTASQSGNTNYNAATAVSQTLTVSSGLSTNDFEKLAFKLYPNPTSNYFEIESKETLTKVEVYSLQGQSIKSFELQNKYDISDLTTGIYFVKIQANNKEITKRIIKE